MMIVKYTFQTFIYFQTIILVLQNKKERSKLELEYLRRAFKNLKFFQEKKEQLNDKS